MARPREPIDLVVAKGKKHLTKDEIEARKNTEVKAPSDNIEAPSYLTDELKEKFNVIAKELINIGIMSNLDCEALARFIAAEHQYQQITIKLLKLKTIGKKYFEYMNFQEKAFKMARQAATDLGLTISSRCKLVIPKKENEKPKNKFTKFM
jgi:P27 family predicted phage terminase small subunit